MIKRSKWMVSLIGIMLLTLVAGCAAPVADTGGAAPAGESAAMASEEGYPEEMVVGMGALPVTLVGNTIPSLQSRIFSTLMYETLAVLNEETGAVEPNPVSYTHLRAHET